MNILIGLAILAVSHLVALTLGAVIGLGIKTEIEHIKEDSNNDWK